MSLDEKEVKEAVEIVINNRNGVTWCEESSKQYNNATDILIRAAKRYLKGVEDGKEMVRKKYNKILNSALGESMCMDCGKTFKTTEQSKHECKKDHWLKPIERSEE